MRIWWSFLVLTSTMRITPQTATADLDVHPKIGKQLAEQETDETRFWTETELKAFESEVQDEIDKFLALAMEFDTVMPSMIEEVDERQQVLKRFQSAEDKVSYVKTISVPIRGKYLKILMINMSSYVQGQAAKEIGYSNAVEDLLLRERHDWLILKNIKHLYRYLFGNPIPMWQKDSSTIKNSKGSALYADVPYATMFLYRNGEQWYDYSVKQVDDILQDVEFISADVGTDGKEGIPLDDWLLFERVIGSTRTMIQNVRLFLESMKSLSEGESVMKFIKRMTHPELGLTFCPIKVFNVYKMAIKRQMIYFEPEMKGELEEILFDAPICKGAIDHEIPKHMKHDDATMEAGADVHYGGPAKPLVPLHLQKIREQEIIEAIVQRIEYLIEKPEITERPPKDSKKFFFHSAVRVSDTSAPWRKGLVEESVHKQRWISELEDIVMQLREIFCDDKWKCKVVDQHRLELLGQDVGNMQRVLDLLKTTFTDMLDRKFQAPISKLSKLSSSMLPKMDSLRV